ncbi:MAG: fructose-specific PTS transporter subunit EIIC [Breznakia sp.]
MKITDVLDVDSIDLQSQITSKEKMMDVLVSLMEKGDKLKDANAYKEAVWEREAQGTTGIGNGIAIPHGLSSAVKKAGLSAVVCKNGVDFDALDQKPVRLAFMIAAPADANKAHLKMLSKLSALLMNEAFVEALVHAKSKEEFLTIIKQGEVEKKKVQTSGHIDYLAVTSCPTGIAHTYMAQEALEKAAEKKGVQIKVETRGSGGTKNTLSSAEIKHAKAIIVATDTNVPMTRFNGKKVIETSVSEAISKADDLLDRAENENVAIYNNNEKLESNVASNKSGITRSIYKHLMNGVSHMLPFVVGGGILIAVAFLIDGLNVDMNALNAEDKGSFGSITPIAATFKNIGGIAFGFMLPILSGFIAMSISDRPGLAVGFIGGSLAASGTSGFLGALVAGFIAGYLVILIKKACAYLPQSLDGLIPILIIPVFGILTIGLLMTYVVEPPVGELNTLINNGLTSMSGTSLFILGALVAAMMAVDMGGPVNKAAYVFGTASIASGNYEIMAAVMIGGMVPPCIIALATILFKNRFTLEERKAGPTNFIMGLSFITEGVIPFAASDPLRVIPSCIAGSALAGALSIAFSCTLMAPHGGIFVFPVVGNAVFYLIALLAGTFLGAVLLGILKKPISQEA